MVTRRPPSRWTTALPALLVLVGVAAFLPALSAPLVLDDHAAITNNATIRRLWPPTTMLSPPADSAVAGRPVLNVTLALNHAIGGLDVRGYHAVNIAIHLAATLVLFGIVRRTLESPALAARFGAAARPLAAACALVWMVHPLQTETVYYVVQRTESTMGLLYLLTLYASIRARPGSRPRTWSALAIAACALGMATKETMVTAPVVVVLYDVVFGGRAGAWRRGRLPLYAGLAATWLVLALLMMPGPRAASVGFDMSVGVGTYALNQCLVVTRYLRLVVWPHPLTIDYGFPRPVTLGAALLPVLLLAGLVVATVVSLVRRPPVGFALAWFFVILAPTSSLVPIATEVAAERRMYLSLAGLVTLVVVGAYGLAQRRDERHDARTARRLAVVGLLVVAATLTAVTTRRARDFATVETIWMAAVRAVPDNPRAHNNLANIRRTQGRIEEAITHHTRAVELRETLALDSNEQATGLYNLGRVLQDAGRFEAAIARHDAAIARVPTFLEAHHLRGECLLALGRPAEAIAAQRRVLRLDPDDARAHAEIGRARLREGRTAEAIVALERALALDPARARIHETAAEAFRRQGDLAAALRHGTEATRLAPGDADLHAALGYTLAQAGRPAEAEAAHRRALTLAPEHPEAHGGLGTVLVTHGRLDEAIASFRRVVAVHPDDAAGHANLGATLARSNRLDEAIVHLRQAVALDDASADAHGNLGGALAAAGRHDEAIASLRHALALEPDHRAAGDNLGRVLTGAGRLDEARRHLERTTRRHPERASTLALLAAAYAADGRLDDAERTAEQALARATAAGDDGLATRLRADLARYRRGR